MKEALTIIGVTINFVGVVVLVVNAYFDHVAIKTLGEHHSQQVTFGYVDAAVMRLESRIDTLAAKEPVVIREPIILPEPKVEPAKPAEPVVVPKFPRRPKGE